MALSILPSSSSGSRAAQLLSATALGLFLGLSYMVVKQEIRASEDASDQPAKVSPAKPVVDPTVDGPEESTQQEAKPAKRREGTRRDWYERRKRRWVTPPEIETDRGLPKQRRFKLS